MLVETKCSSAGFGGFGYALCYIFLTERRIKPYKPVEEESRW